MQRKKLIPERFTVRLTGTNREFLKEFLQNEPDIGEKNKSGAINMIISRYFLYEKHSKLIHALEDYRN